MLSPGSPKSLKSLKCFPHVMEVFGFVVDPVAPAVCAWVVSTAVELSDLHTLRAVGYLILSVEGLIVTWLWPRLFPAPRGERSSQRHHRHGHRHRRRRRRDDAAPQHAITPDSARSRRDESGEPLGDQDDATELWSDGSKNNELSSPVLSDGIPALTNGRGDRGPNRRVTGYSEANASTWANFLAQDSIPAKLPGANEDVSATRRTRVDWVRRTRVGWMRRILLVLFTLSATCLATWLVISGIWNLIPVLGKPPSQGTGIVGGPGSSAKIESCVVVGPCESEEAEGAKRGKREGGSHKELPKVDDEIRREETKLRRKVEESRNGNGIERPKRKWEFWSREERRDKSKKRRQDSAAAEAVVNAGANVDAAEGRVRRRNEKEREATAASKGEETKTVGVTASATAEDTHRQREVAEADVLLLSEEQRAASHQARWEGQNQGNSKGIAPETCSYTLEEGKSLGLEQALHNGPTEMRLMSNGDVVLFFDGLPVWRAQGSKKRRSVLGWIWRKIRRRATPRQCSKCRFTVTSSGRLEIRERRKLLWSDGLPKRTAKKKKRTPAATLPENASAHAENCPDDICSTYRLEVTDDGNAVLKLGDFEVVWKALGR